MDDLKGRRQLPRATRLAAIAELPSTMQDCALVGWETVAAVLDKDDVQTVSEQEALQRSRAMARHGARGPR
jgi:hypothetical protein